MKYVEMTYEMGSRYDVCTGSSEWIRQAHVVTADTKKELAEKKKEIEKQVKNINISYIQVYLKNWEKI